MNLLYKAKLFLEEAMVGGSSTNHPQDFVNESLEKAFSIHRSLDRAAPASQSSVIGVGLLPNDRLEIALDKAEIQSREVCDQFKTDFCRKAGLNESQVTATLKPMTRLYWDVQVGAPVAHRELAVKGSYGTLGCFLLNPQGNNRNYIVSNNHVLANSNHGKIGDDLHWTQYDKPRIGQLANFVPISREVANQVDLAVGTFEGPFLGHYRAVRGVRTARIGEIVTKVGARTGWTVGRIRSLHYSLKVDFEGPVFFQDQLQIITANGVPFSQPGDSGAGIFAESDGSFVGLLFAGNGTDTNANHGTAVADQIKTWGYVKK